MSLAVPATVAVVVGLSEADQLTKGHGFTAKPLIGGFILGIFLFGIGAVDNRLGTLFAVLVVVSAFLTHGQAVLNKIGGKL